MSKKISLTGLDSWYRLNEDSIPYLAVLFDFAQPSNTPVAVAKNLQKILQALNESDAEKLDTKLCEVENLLDQIKNDMHVFAARNSK